VLNDDDDDDDDGDDDVLILNPVDRFIVVRFSSTVLHRVLVFLYEPPCWCCSKPLDINGVLSLGTNVIVTQLQHAIPTQSDNLIKLHQRFT